MFITEEQLLQMLLDYTRCAPVTASIETEVRMNKTRVIGEDKETGKPIKEQNPYVGATCTKRINGMINFEYSNSVNNQREREGKATDFNPYERKWGVHMTKAVIGHKGEYYLQMKLENSYDPTYQFEGTIIDYSLLKPFIPVRNSSRQGVEKEVQVRDVKLCNILKITIDKVEYTINRG